MTERSINLFGPIDPYEVYVNLASSYFAEVESIIRTRISPVHLARPGHQKLIKEIVDGFLIRPVENLREIVPGCNVFWDDHVDMKTVYSAFPTVIVDVVDGARNLWGGGSNVTSTLAIVCANNEIPLAVVSYPFTERRIASLDGDVYYLPAKTPGKTLGKSDPPEDFRMIPRGSTSNLMGFRISERYDVSPSLSSAETDLDSIRSRLDTMRHHLEKSIKRPVGSLAMRLVSVVTGEGDVYIGKRSSGIPPHDYLAAAKIIKDLGGVVTDIDGLELDGQKPANGIIAASNPETYRAFRSFLDSDK